MNTQYNIVEHKPKNHERPKRKHRRRRTTIYKWLRDRTSSIDYGVKFRGHPIHCNKNEAVLEAFQRQRWLSRMTNAKFDQHFAGIETYYFTGNSRTRANETLAMIDIDCHKTGTLAGAIRFAQYVKDHHYPKLYFEVSTNGNGVHGYIVVEKSGLAPKFLNPLLKRLDHHLKALLHAGDFEVENVEVKGTCPVFTWGEKRGELTNYKSGQLAKLPREAHRFEELKNTTRLSYMDLLKLPLVETVSREATVTLAATRESQPVGSVSGKVIGEDELERLSGHYREVASLLMETHSLATTGRAVATVEDVAIFLLVLRFCTANMNEDGSLPYARFEGLWSALHEAGDVHRPFDCKRFAAIRNYLSSLGLLDWEDNNYTPGRTDEHGKDHRGKACRWKASELLMGMLDEEKTGHDMAEIGESSGIDKEEERGASLAGTDLSKIIHSLVRTPENDVIRPVEIDDHPSWRLNADEIAQYISFFDLSPALAA